MKKIFCAITFCLLIFASIRFVFADTTWEKDKYFEFVNNYKLSGTTFEIKFSYSNKANSIAVLQQLPYLFPIAQGYTLPLRYEEVPAELCKTSKPKWIGISWNKLRKNSSCRIKYLDNKTKKWKTIKLKKNNKHYRIDLYRYVKKKNIGKKVLILEYKYKVNKKVYIKRINISYWKDISLK